MKALDVASASRVCILAPNVMRGLVQLDAARIHHFVVVTSM